MTFRCPREWNLSLQQTYAVEALMDAQRCVSTGDLAQLIAVAGGRADADLARVVMCNVRKKLRPFGISIFTSYAKGYFLDPDTKAALLAGAVSLRKDAA